MKEPNMQPADRPATVGGQLDEIPRTVEDKASEVKQKVGQVVDEQKSEIGGTARGLVDKARDKVEAVADEQISAGAEYIGSIARAVDRAAGEFEDSVPQAARYIRQASGQMQDIAEAVRQRDLAELLNEVRDFARRQPALFFGGTLLLGFAAARFLKSADGGSGRQQAANREWEQPEAGSF
jgi:hypothetical protein